MGYILNIVHALMRVGLELEVFQIAYLLPCAPRNAFVKQRRLCSVHRHCFNNFSEATSLLRFLCHCEGLSPIILHMHFLFRALLFFLLISLAWLVP